jgi:hypothetical protein
MYRQCIRRRSYSSTPNTNCEEIFFLKNFFLSAHQEKKKIFPGPNGLSLWAMCVCFFFASFLFVLCVKGRGDARATSNESGAAPCGHGQTPSGQHVHIRRDVYIRHYHYCPYINGFDPKNEFRAFNDWRTIRIRNVIFIKEWTNKTDGKNGQKTFFSSIVDWAVELDYFV